MNTRTLGNSDMQITPLGFGAWAIGGGGWAFGWGPQYDADSVGPPSTRPSIAGSTGSTRRRSTDWAIRRRSWPGLWKGLRNGLTCSPGVAPWSGRGTGKIGKESEGGPLTCWEGGQPSAGSASRLSTSTRSIGRSPRRISKRGGPPSPASRRKARCAGSACPTSTSPRWSGSGGLRRSPRCNHLTRCCGATSKPRSSPTAAGTASASWLTHPWFPGCSRGR